MDQNRNGERRNGQKSKFSTQIVISGISGKYPESANIQEFQENLFNGVDMITDDPNGDRWPEGIFGIPKRCGKLSGLDKFDAQFFSVSAKQADFMDPQLRLLLELTHEAIFDAGVNPATLRGKNVGVFVGASESESSTLWTQNPDDANGYSLLGCQKSMFANRISFCFDFKGPSFTMDTACSSSLLALEKAVNAIRNGECDAAVVGGASVLLTPISTLQFNRLQMLSPDGKCKSFDADGNGYVRSEAAAVVFIQKKDVALRSYAEVLHAKTNTDGHKELGVTFPSGERQAELLEQVYAEAQIDPKDVVYVEAHGTGTQAGDPQELNAITRVFCKEDRERPLLIGSVKSNMGHSEPCSGLCGVTKLAISIQNGVLPANLHFNTPNPKIPALVDGRIKVVTENTPWDGGLAAINSFGFGGANVHVVLRSNSKRDNQKIASRFPIIIPFSGRTSESTEMGLQSLSGEINNNGLDHERISLLHKIYQNGGISGHAYRGYAVVDENASEKLVKLEVKESSDQSKPNIWFVFPGMGSQWKTNEWRAIGRDLMKLPVFAKSVLRSIKIIKDHEKGIDFAPFFLPDSDLSANETRELEKMEKRVVYSFVGIATVQIALVDLLTSLNIRPDGIIGHSVGELACAYADGCFTAEQTILAAFFRGLATEAVTKYSTFSGAMAAIGLTWEEAKQRCPPGIHPACHNSIDSVTVSGPLEILQSFVQNLQNEGIFAKLIDTNGLAFHSKYIQGAGPIFKHALETIVPEPRSRSSRWISSSVPEIQWDSDLAKMSSPAYHVNNVVSPVLFHEALQHVPKNAVVVEIGPHCLLQSVLKRALPDCAQIGLVNKTKEDGINQILQMTGQLFNLGLSPNFSELYKSVEFPVSSGTGSLSHIVSSTWDHSQSWNVAKYQQGQKSETGEIQMEISLDKENDAFYKGHKIDGRLLFPATGYLLLVWKAFAKSQSQESNVSYEQVPVVFEKVKLKRATVLPQVTDDLHPPPPVKFSLNIFKATGEFQLSNAENGTLLVAGIVRSPKDSSEFMSLGPSKGQTQAPDQLSLSSEDVYKELRLRGYEYSGEFQAIHKTDIRSEGQCEKAEVKFHGNWVTFLDNFLQLTILSKPNRALYLPTFLDKVILDPLTFRRSLKRLISDDDDNERSLGRIQVPVYHFKNLQVVTCEGVQVQRCRAEIVQKRSDVPSNGTLIMEKQEFVPFLDSRQSLCSKSLRACMSIVLDNSQDYHLQIVEAVQDPENSVAASVQEIILHQTSEVCDVHQIKHTETVESEDFEETVSNYFDGEIEDDLVILNNPAEDALQLIENVTLTLKNGAFLLVILPTTKFLEDIFIKKMEQQSLTILTAQKISNNGNFYLLKKGIFDAHFGEEISNDENLSKIIYLDQYSVDDNNNIVNNNNREFAWVEPLKQAMKQSSVSGPENESSRIYLVSRETGKKASGILGLVNCIRREPGGDKIRCIFIIGDDDNSTLDFSDSFNNSQDTSFSKSFGLSEILRRDLVNNIFDSKSKTWGTLVFFALDQEPSTAAEHAYINWKTRDLSNLRWFESPLKYHENPTELCSVYYSALNFRDVMLASGKLALSSLPNNLGLKDCVLGMEYSGIMPNGQRVMGLLPAQAMATTLIPQPETLYHVPKSWTLAEAATVPIAYSTGYYALIVRGGLQRGESVLIHCGAGAVGTASIAIALSMDCKVFTTVGSMEKREFLRNMFPQLDDSAFANSRDTSFLPHILNETNGRGVDLVLNSLAGEKLECSIKCLAQHGRFLEIGKVDLFEDNNLGMAVLLKNVTVCGILLDSLFHSPGANANDTNGHQNQVWELMNQGLKTGVVRPLPFTIFSDSNDEIERAFRFMATGKHRGKILLEFQKEDLLNRNQTKTVQALPRSYFDPNKSYVIVGGLGGVGLELAGFLVERGARHLILVSRSGVQTGYQSLRLRMWRDKGVKILTPTLDLATTNGARALFDFNTNTDLNPKKDPVPVGGIFNLAMDLADGLLEGQTPENFKKVSRPKIQVTKCLDKISREDRIAKHLDHFVVYSSLYVSHSVSSAKGLSTYSYANAASERICARRKNDGFPALAIQWGPIGEVGVLQNKTSADSSSTRLIGGTLPQKISSCLSSLDILLNESRYNQQNSSSANQHETCVLNCMIMPTPDEITRRDADSLLGATRGNSSLNLMDKVAKILGMKPGDLNRMNMNTKLSEIGMDSLMAVEIKQLIDMRASAQNTSATTTNLHELTLGKITEMMESENSKTSPKDNQDVAQKRTKTTSRNTKPVQNGGKLIQNGGKSIQSGEKLIQNGGSFISHSASSADNVDLAPTPTSSLTEIKNSDSKIPSLDKIWSVFYQNWDLRSLLFYSVGAFALLVTGILCLISYFLRQGTQLYINIFKDPTQLKIMTRPYDALFATNSQESNIAITLKCAGIPIKSKLVRTLNDRLIKWRTNIRLDKTNNDNFESENDVEFYSPYDILRWRIVRGFFFHYWQKDVDFDMENHVIVDELCADANLDEEAKKVSEFYHSRQWENVSFENKRPQWEFRVLVPKYNLNHPEEEKEFLVVFAIHHSYSDAVSLLQLLQYALRDHTDFIKTISSHVDKPKPALEQKPEKTHIVQQDSSVQILKKIISTGKNSTVQIHNLICEMSRLIQIKNGNTISLSRFEKPKGGATKKFCGLVNLNLSEIKSLRYKSPQGNSIPIPMTTIILRCATAAFEKIFTSYNRKSLSKMDPIQGNLVSLMPYTIFPAKKLDLVNSLTTMHTSLSTLNSDSDFQTQSAAGTSTSKVEGQGCQSFEQIIDIGKKVEKSCSHENLENSYELNCLFSNLTNQMIGLLFKYFFPSPTFIYSNVPASIPRSSSFLGGYSVKDFYGDAMLAGESVGALASVIDSENDTCALSLIIDERAKDISPSFHQEFFMHFQQELDDLVQIQNKLKLGN